MRATKIAFEQQYSDNSGVEFAVRLDNDEIEFESTVGKLNFPIEKLSWLIDAMNRIKEEVKKCQDN